jgi:DNA replication protein DnaC
MTVDRLDQLGEGLIDPISPSSVSPALGGTFGAQRGRDSDSGARVDAGIGVGGSDDRASGPCPLGMCDGSGFVIDEATNTASDCRCRAGRIARVRAARLEGRIPRRYQGVSFERPPVSDLSRTAPAQIQSVRRYVRSIEQNLDVGRGLWIQGDIGTGKTTLAMLISKTALDASRSVAIYSLPRLLNLLRESMDSETGMLDFMDRLTAVDLLHLDDLGAEHQTEWVLEQLYSIVNARYEAQRAIVATTNLMPDELSERLGARTVSRLVEICGDLIPLYGEDKRREFPIPARTG